jgi:hypothetical protein
MKTLPHRVQKEWTIANLSAASGPPVKSIGKRA